MITAANKLSYYIGVYKGAYIVESVLRTPHGGRSRRWSAGHSLGVGQSTLRSVGVHSLQEGEFVWTNECKYSFRASSSSSFSSALHSVSSPFLKLFLIFADKLLKWIGNLNMRMLLKTWNAFISTFRFASGKRAAAGRTWSNGTGGARSIAMPVSRNPTSIGRLPCHQYSATWDRKLVPSWSESSKPYEPKTGFKLLKRNTKKDLKTRSWNIKWIHENYQHEANYTDEIIIQSSLSSAL